MTNVLNAIKSFFNDLQQDYKFNKYVKKVEPEFVSKITVLYDVYETGQRHPKVKEYINKLNHRINIYIAKQKADKLAETFGRDSIEYKDFIHDYVNNNS